MKRRFFALFLNRNVVDVYTASLVHAVGSRYPPSERGGYTSRIVERVPPVDPAMYDMHHRRSIRIATLAIGALFVAACGAQEDTPNQRPAPIAAPQFEDAGETSIPDPSDPDPSDGGLPDADARDRETIDEDDILPVDPDSGDVADSDADAEVDPDADTVPDGTPDADADTDATTDTDSGGWIPPDDIEDPVVLQTGANGVLLRGMVLTIDDILDPGEVLIVGNEIVCVAASCTGDFRAADATWIDTRGVISPGLVDAHNHLPYNFLPEWRPPGDRFYENRYEWADEDSYEDHVRPYARRRSTGSHFCPAGKWGELRSVIHGTTTIQGQTFNQQCIQGMVRNADTHHGLGPSHMRTSIGSPREINDADAEGYLASFAAGTTRFAVHMQEGYNGNNILLEFESFAGRDTRTNRHAGTSLLGEHSILIHSVSLTEAQLIETRDAGGKIVWSPSSNFVLYDVTAPIERILELGIQVSLAPDWTPSGEDNMLGEIRYAYDYARAEGIDVITPELLWEMSTWRAADVVGLEAHLGRLEVGYRADIFVTSIPGGDDPYRAILETRADHVRLVMIDGVAYYGDDMLREAMNRDASCDLLDACGSDKFLCVSGSFNATTGGDTVDEIYETLYNIMEGLPIAGRPVPVPEDEQYGRGDEVLPLIDCSE